MEHEFMDNKATWPRPDYPVGKICTFKFFKTSIQIWRNATTNLSRLWLHVTESKEVDDETFHVVQSTTVFNIKIFFRQRLRLSQSNHFSATNNSEISKLWENDPLGNFIFDQRDTCYWEMYSHSSMPILVFPFAQFSVHVCIVRARVQPTLDPYAEAFL